VIDKPIGMLIDPSVSADIEAKVIVSLVYRKFK
jgi:hypothetical protein